MMVNVNKIIEALETKRQELEVLNNPLERKTCKSCGNPSLAGDEPLDIFGEKRITLETEIRILEWVLEC